MAAPEAEAKEEAQKKSPKDRILSQINSLADDDDERTAASKKISWILRHGARQCGVKQERDKWVNFADLAKAEILKDLSEDELWKIVVDFNGKKLRYELSEDKGTRYIRCYKKTVRKALDAAAGGGALRGAADDDAPHGLRTTAPEFNPTTAPGGQQGAAYAAFAQQAAAYMGYGYGYGYGYNPMYNNPAMWQQPQGGGGKFFGWIKSFSAEKGYGFIESSKAWNLYGKDVFLHKSEIGDLQVGAEVTFRCELNNQGMPQAKDVKPKQGGTGPSGATGTGKAKEEKGKGKGKGKGMKYVKKEVSDKDAQKEGEKEGDKKEEPAKASA